MEIKETVNEKYGILESGGHQSLINITNHDIIKQKDAEGYHGEMERYFRP